MTTVLDVLNDDNLLGPFFTGSSWAAWRLVLKATFGQAMSSAERVRFRALAEREPPPGRVREAFFAVGRRGGKDSVASAIVVYAAVFGDFARFLRPGERPVALIIASTKEQATGILAYIAGYFDGRVPMLAPLVQRITDESIELTTGVDIIVLSGNYRTIRGRTVAVAIFNELAFWRDNRYANPDIETYSAVLPAMVTLRRAGSILIGISSVHRKLGLLYDKFLAHHGKDDPSVLFIKAPSVTFNPTIDQADIDLDTALDPEKARAEWLSEWRTDISNYIDRDLVESLIDVGVRERPHNPAIRNYVAFADESGGSGSDASTLCIVHQDHDQRIIQDLARRWSPPFVTSSVIEEKARLLKSYGLREVTMDHWAGGLPPSLFAAQGIEAKPAAPKSNLYIDFLGILNSRRMLMLDEPVQIGELCSLERRTAWGGRDSIDHSQISGAHDDAINALAGAAVLAATEAPGLHVSAEAVERARAATPRRGHGGYRDPLFAFQSRGRAW
jgi:hypothetical protein